MIFFPLLILLFVWILGKLIAYYKLCKAVRPVPGKPTHWFWGNVHEFRFAEDTMMKLLKWRYDRHLKMSKFWLGPLWVAVNIHHPDLVKHILKTPKSERMYDMLEYWLGKGLLLANGNKWYRNRHLLTPAFHFDILKPYVYVYNECTDILLSKWEAIAKEGQDVQVYSAISELSLDIILRCAFSYQSGCQEKQIKDPYVLAVGELCDLSAHRAVSLLLSISDFLYFYCTPQGWKYRRAAKIVHEQAEKIINERRQSLGLNDNTVKRQQSEIFSMAKAAHKYLDFLDVLLTAKDEEGCGLTDLEIRNEVDTFMFEGHDTTANAITWTLYLLAKHPEHQEKCREEVRNILRGRDHLEYDDLANLKYTQMCIKESMRIYPPVFRVFRKLHEDTVLDGHSLPKGTLVNIGIIDIHRNPSVWDKPMEFNPLRFHPDNDDNRSPFSYIPFSAGPRNCIGQNFALNEERVVISSILNRFSLSLVNNDEVKANMIVLLRPNDDVKLHIKLLES